ncbi:MAG: 3'-5' exonuclease [Brevibacillus sp.]|nr:3'-5' exonuclease [Brevibacillus sp.]
MRGEWNPIRRLWHSYRGERVLPDFRSVSPKTERNQQAFLRQMVKDMEQPGPALPLDSLRAVVVDLETTGFYPFRGDEIIAIGAVAVFGTEVRQEERFFSLVQPTRPIPEHIRRLTGITAADLSNAPSLVTSLSAFFQFVGDRPLIAHHSRHERQFLQAGLWNTSRTRFAHRLIDTMLLIRVCEGVLGDSSLDALCRHNRIAIHKRHDAYWDAFACAQLWTHYVKQALRLGFRDLQEIYREHRW